MLRNLGLLVTMSSLAVLACACTSATTESRPFENEVLSLTVPAGWQTTQEVWGERAAAEQDFKGLGVKEVFAMQYPAGQGEGETFFVVASSPLAEGQDLESRSIEAYEGAVPEIEDLLRQPFEQGGISGYEVTYRRPWGEPWWQFRDIWLEHKGVVYLLSSYSSPGSFEADLAVFDQILESFELQD